MLKICGPKLAITGIIISVWGLFQLVLMGVFFFVESPALIEDLPMEEHDYIQDAYQNHGIKIQAAYRQQALNCWVCAGLYALLLIFSGQQAFQSLRQSSYTGM
ncbi:putative Ribonuclease kappa [Hypsibius exemplaris]|uniref:Ribonuclease kappa n=1 Tax=Hypsibius exemplaris TaxID=2072580 RepID=A0A1W0WV34_HYPEX|nr:putative Ribonuclease kappa [Hypsibius exemplaris]